MFFNTGFAHNRAANHRSRPGRAPLGGMPRSFPRLATTPRGWPYTNPLAVPHFSTAEEVAQQKHEASEMPPPSARKRASRPAAEAATACLLPRKPPHCCLHKHGHGREAGGPRSQTSDEAAQGQLRPKAPADLGQPPVPLGSALPARPQPSVRQRTRSSQRAPSPAAG